MTIQKRKIEKNNRKRLLTNQYHFWLTMFKCIAFHLIDIFFGVSIWFFVFVICLILVNCHGWLLVSVRTGNLYTSDHLLQTRQNYAQQQQQQPNPNALFIRNQFDLVSSFLFFLKLCTFAIDSWRKTEKIYKMKKVLHRNTTIKMI